MLPPPAFPLCYICESIHSDSCQLPPNQTSGQMFCFFLLLLLLVLFVCFLVLFISSPWELPGQFIQPSHPILPQRRWRSTSLGENQAGTRESGMRRGGVEVDTPASPSGSSAPQAWWCPFWSTAHLKPTGRQRHQVHYCVTIHWSANRDSSPEL